jgi:hypothetical protein
MLPQGYDKLSNMGSVSIKDLRSCPEKAFNFCIPCCCRPEYKVNDVQQSRMGLQTHYLIKKTSCCWPEWTVYDGHSKQQVSKWIKTGIICPCGGPGIDHENNQKRVTGRVWMPFQCCNSGIDIKDANGDKKFYIGSNWGCYEGMCNIFCCKNVCSFAECCKHHCCEDNIYPAPIYDPEKRLRLGTTNLIVPCIHACIPCCGDPYYVTTFPAEANTNDKMGMISAHMIFDNRFLFYMKKGELEL